MFKTTLLHYIIVLNRYTKLLSIARISIWKAVLKRNVHFIFRLTFNSLSLPFWYITSVHCVKSFLKNKKQEHFSSGSQWEIHYSSGPRLVTNFGKHLFWIIFLLILISILKGSGYCYVYYKDFSTLFCPAPVLSEYLHFHQTLTFWCLLFFFLNNKVFKTRSVVMYDAPEVEQKFKKDAFDKGLCITSYFKIRMVLFCRRIK